MALLSTGSCSLEYHCVFAGSFPYPCYCYYFFANDAIICSNKNRLREPVFCVIRSALSLKILLNSRQRPLLAKQCQRVIQLGAKGHPGSSNADEAKEHTGLVASGLEELVESVLDSTWRPCVLLSQSGVVHSKELSTLLVRQFA